MISNDIKFLYSYFNQFLLIIRNKSLFIIIKVKSKSVMTKYVSKWQIKHNRIISNNIYNCKKIDSNHINLLFGDTNSDNKIEVCSKIYNYDNNSIFGKTLNILDEMKIFKK